MTDDELRRLERSWRAGDPASEGRWLRERLRAGALAPEKVELAAWLEHEPALEVLGKTAPAEARPPEEWLLGLVPFGREACLRAAIATARASLRAVRMHLRRFDEVPDLAWALVDAVEDAVRASPEAALPRVRELQDAIDAASQRQLDSGPYPSQVFAVASLVSTPDSFEDMYRGVAGSWSSHYSLRALRAEVKHDLVPWALGGGDPVRERSRAEGRTVACTSDIVRVVQFSPDGARLLVAGRCGAAQVHDVAARRLVATTERRRHDVYAAAWSPDGKRLLLGNQHGELALHDAATGAPLGTLDAKAEQVNDVLWLPDGGRVVTAHHDRTARLWDVAERRVLRTFEGGEQPLAALAADASGRRLVLGGRDGSIRLVRLDTDEVLPLIAHESSIEDVALTPDGRFVLSAGYDATNVWDVAARTRVATIPHHASGYVVAAAPDSRRAAATTADHQVQVFDVATGAIERTWEWFPSLPLALGWSPDGRSLAVGLRNGGVRVLSVD